MDDFNSIQSIIILTDGNANFPDESINRNNIPILWVLNNKQIVPPYGKIARINSND